VEDMETIEKKVKKLKTVSDFPNMFKNHFSEKYNLKEIKYEAN
jgi:hypothetical protein